MLRLEPRPPTHVPEDEASSPSLWASPEVKKTQKLVAQKVYHFKVSLESYYIAIKSPKSVHGITLRRLGVKFPSDEFSILDVYVHRNGRHGIDDPTLALHPSSLSPI